MSARESRSDDVLLRARTRRHFFHDCRVGLGGLALGALLSDGAVLGRASRAEVPGDPSGPRQAMAPRMPHFAARAKNVIYLFMAGGPSQLELFDYKPELQRLHGEVVPPSLVKDKRFAFIPHDAKLLGTRRSFRRYGECGAEMSDLLPEIGALADKISLVKSVSTDVFNHGPAKLFMNTGSPRFGRPSMGAWVTYGIGSEARDLPGFVVLQSGPRGPRGGAPLWGSGFLPTTYQGAPFLSGPEPILNLRNPPGITPRRQRRFFEAVRDLNSLRLAAVGDPEVATRVAAYETAYRMQSSAPELMDLRQESPGTLEAYGAEPGKSSYANNCLLARRLVERGVRFVQLYHTDWDHHGGRGADLTSDLEKMAHGIDGPTAALLRDLDDRGLLDETLVIWGGEFGRTPMGENRETPGRDHHIDTYTMWFAGGGVRSGVTIGATDELGFAPVEDPVHVHDVQATVLHLLGLDHEQLTFRFQGREFRLTDIAGRVVEGLLA